MSRRSIISWLGIGLAVAALASIEFVYEYLSGAAPDASMCLTPESKKEAVKEVLMHHMHGH